MGDIGPENKIMWLQIEEFYKDLLRRNELRRFQDFMTFRGGKVLKQLPSRSILKIEFSSGAETKVFFMKRHKGSLSLGEVIRAFLSGFSLSWGRKEWEVIQAFQKSGIPTLTPVAAGERVSWFRQESFLLTEELKGFQSLELFLKSHFMIPLSREKMKEKRAIIQELARIIRNMHEAGFNHRDLYCCHIFIQRQESGKREWRVLDLQRVDRRRWFRSRWITKDLAALNYSAPSPFITRTDRLRFLRCYLGGQNSLRENGPLIRHVIRKSGKIRQHDLKLQQRKAIAHDREGRLTV